MPPQCLIGSDCLALDPDQRLAFGHLVARRLDHFDDPTRLVAGDFGGGVQPGLGADELRFARLPLGRDVLRIRFQALDVRPKPVDLTADAVHVALDVQQIFGALIP